MRREGGVRRQGERGEEREMVHDCIVCANNQ